MQKQIIIIIIKLCSPKLNLFFGSKRGLKSLSFQRELNFQILLPAPLFWSKNLLTPFISLIPLSILSSGGDGGLLHFPRLIISFLLLSGRRYFRVIYFLYSRKNCTTAIIFASPDHLIAIILRRPHHLIIFILDYLMII